MEFSYGAISSLGGLLVIAVGITVLFEQRAFKCVYGLLLVGGLIVISASLYRRDYSCR